MKKDICNTQTQDFQSQVQPLQPSITWGTVYKG